MTTREQLHGLVDELPEEAFDQACANLIRLREAREDPFWRKLAEADPDDEPLSPSDIAAIEHGRRSLAAGHGISTEALKELLGL